MTAQPLRMQPPPTDPTPIFEAFHGNFVTELMTAAVAHFDLFGQLAAGGLSHDALRQRIGLAERAATVLFTALRAMGLLETDADGQITLSALSRGHLIAGGPFYVGNYLGLAATRPGVLELVERLRTNTPAGASPDAGGTAFIYREGTRSAMDEEQSARDLTLALSGRARNVAPVLAARLPMRGTRVLLDVGGGTGIYSFALLQQNPELRAIIYDRPEVLKVADELAHEYGVADRTELAAGDMFNDPLPECDAALLSNILHDWDVPECRALVGRCAAALRPGGRVLIHDVFLNDAMDGPLPVALYSAALFRLTEGRAYSRLEYAEWLREAALSANSQPVPTLVNCGVLIGTKT